MNTTISEIAAFLRGREFEGYGAIGITPPTRGHIRCPLGTHADRNPSFRVDARTGKWHCTCGHGDVIDAAVSLGYAPTPIDAARFIADALGLPTAGKIRNETPDQRAARKKRHADALRKSEAARRARDRESDRQNAETVEWIRNELWEWCYPPKGTLVETYLKNRGISIVPDILSFLPSYGRDKLPAMLAPFGIAAEPELGTYEIWRRCVVGAHITLLTQDGQKARDREGRTKIILGRRHDAPLMLVPPNDGMSLVIGEGIEKSLAWAEATGVGAWASGTAGRLPAMAKFVPRWIEHVTIIEDDNEAGRKGCRALGNALTARETDVAITRGKGAFDDAA